MPATDESCLRALSLTYADAVRAADAEAWAATWLPDARWVLGPGRDVQGVDALVTMWRSSLAKYARVVQLYLSSTYDIDGDDATGRCQFLELNELVDGSRKVLAGHYDDTYRRTADGWRFASRELTTYYAGPADLTGEFR